MERFEDGRPASHLDRPLPVLHERTEGTGRDDFTKIPNGAPGVEHRVSLIYNGGVVENRISR